MPFSDVQIFAMQHLCIEQCCSLKIISRKLDWSYISKADVSNSIIGGDWNVTLEAIDKKSGIQWNPTVNRDLAVEFMDELLNLVEILRMKNPCKRCFHYESNAFKMKSIIDRMISSSLPNLWLQELKLLIIKLRSRPTTMLLDFSCKLKAKKGAGLWKFNNSLLDD